MSTSSITVGLNENARQSSRVQRCPSNGHTNIFGDDPEPPQMRTGRRRAPDCSAQVESAAPEKLADVAEQSNDIEREKVKSSPKPNATEIEKSKQSEDPQKRVRVPPGGFSAGFW